MRNNDIVTGLYLGDEGKGSYVSYLASKTPTHAVVRHSGGAQAAHNVFSDGGIHHTFAQFGSGSFHGAKTILSRFMMVEPYALANEGFALSDKVGWDVFAPLLISENALLTTPIHAALNKAREVSRGASRHGSCGLGIGETTLYKIRHGDFAPQMKDILNPTALRTKLHTLLGYAISEMPDVEEFLELSITQILSDYDAMLKDGLFNGIVADSVISEDLNKGYVIFEGSQGVLLDEALGFHPNTTWSKTTQENAQLLLKETGLPRGNTIGVIRKYGTRHGAGPFPGEILEDTTSTLPESHNGWGEFQGSWRRGYFALPLFEYAVRANKGVDEIAISHADVEFDRYITSFDGFPYLPSDFYLKNRDRQAIDIAQMVASQDKPVFAEGFDSFVRDIEKAANAPVRYLSFGPSDADKVER